MKDSGLMQYLAFTGVFYLVFLAFTVFGYDFSQQYLKPIGGLIFPINEKNSPLYSAVVSSIFYWVIVLGFYFFKKGGKKQK